MSPHLHFLLMVVDLPRDVDVHGAPLPWFLRRSEREEEKTSVNLTVDGAADSNPAAVSLHGRACVLSIFEKDTSPASDAFRFPKVLL